MMTRYAIFIGLAALLCASCGGRRAGSSSETRRTYPVGAQFDPLATPADRVVVPEAYPATAGLTDKKGGPADPWAVIARSRDSLSLPDKPAEVFRVQIFTSRLYAEANREKTIAEEVFDLPIYLDYEVPYYKLRVGDFARREEAEAMLSGMKALGYQNAWVARMVVRIKEIPVYDQLDEPILPEIPSDSASPPDSTSPGER